RTRTTPSSAPRSPRRSYARSSSAPACPHTAAAKAPPPPTRSRTSADARPRSPSKKGEHAYRHLVANWQTQPPTKKAGAGAATGERLGPRQAANLRGGASIPTPRSSVRGHPRPQRSLTPADRAVSTRHRAAGGRRQPDRLKTADRRQTDATGAAFSPRDHPPPPTHRPQPIARKRGPQAAPALDTFIRRVDHSTQLRGKDQERRHVLPGVQPGLRDHGEAGPPRVVERLERRLGGVSIGGGVDRLQVAGDLLALAPGHVLEAVPDQMDEAGLDDRLRVDRLDRLGEALEPVH